MRREVQGVIGLGLECKVGLIKGLTRSGPKVALRPRPGAISQRPGSPSASKRSRHRRTVFRLTFISAAMAASALPKPANSTMRPRRATCCGVPNAANHPSICLCCSFDTTSTGVGRGMIHYEVVSLESRAICLTLHYLVRRNTNNLRHVQHGTLTYRG